MICMGVTLINYKTKTHQKNPSIINRWIFLISTESLIFVCDQFLILWQEIHTELYLK